MHSQATTQSQTLRLWALLSLLGLTATAAQAQVCESWSLKKQTVQTAGGELRLACARALQEGRSAVQTAGSPGADAAGHARWGFVDAQGELVIPALFDAVGDFTHGLSPARLGPHWGFIDLQGRWLVPPSWDEVISFGPMGLAFGRQGTAWQAVNRQGQVTPSNLPPNTVQLKWVADQPDTLMVRRQDYAIDSQGRAAEWASHVQLLQQMGATGNYLARNRASGELGLIQRGGIWSGLGVSGPFTSYQGSPGVLQIELGPDKVALLFQNGRLATRHYSASMIMNRGEHTIPACQADTDRCDLLDVISGQVILSDLSPAQVDSIDSLGSNLLWPKGSGTKVLTRGQTRPQALPSEVVHIAREAPLAQLYDKENRLIGVLPHSGHGMRTDPRWRAAKQVQSVRNMLWIENAQGQQIDILRPDGQSLLTTSVRKRLGVWRLDEPSRYELRGEQDGSEDVPAILAVVVPDSCPCTQAVHGVLLPSGQLVTNKAWQAVSLLNDRSPANGALSDWRLAVRTGAGWGMVDGEGRALTPMTYDGIQPFQHGLAVASRNGRFSVLAFNGQARSLPEFPEVAVVGKGLLRFRGADLAVETLGLYDVERQAVVAEPSWRTITPFQHGLAVASLEADRVGLIDTTGRWTMTPRYRHIHPVSPDLWAGSVPDGAETWELIRSDGTIVANGLGAVPSQIGHWVMAEQRAPDGTMSMLVFLPDGRALRMPPIWSYVVMDDLLGITPNWESIQPAVR